MSSSLCPHLVQEYFERVADIVSTYRPQILKQVEYDKISENLVLRGAVRQEEHQRIFRCANLEGQVSQMLVVIQNRMWGLENLLAAFMEEHVSTWLTQELFRAYMDHLVGPLRKLKEKPVCQCVQTPNSILYRGWVKALKSLDSLILKTGTSLGFMKQTMYPTDNMLAFLSDKLAEYTGGDSCSTVTSNQDDLVPYGFAPNTSGEVQVAELEDDDINDLISLSETLCIGYHSSSDDNFKEIAGTSGTSPKNDLDDDGLMMKNVSVKQSMIKNESCGGGSGGAVVGKPVSRNVSGKRRGGNIKTSSGLTTRRERHSSENETTDSDQHSKNDSTQEKLARQRELIARLSAPKSIKATQTTISSSSSSTPAKQRSRPTELQRSASIPTPSPSNNAPTTGKTQGFVRSKSHAPTSPKSRGNRNSSKSKPVAVTAPNVKKSPKKSKAMNNEDIDSRLEYDEMEEKNDICSADEDEEGIEEEVDQEDNILSKNIKLFQEDEVKTQTEIEEDVGAMLPEMSALFVSKAVFANEQDKAKNLTYYQLNFDSFSDNEQ